MDGGPGCENVKRFFVGKLNFWLIIFEKETYAKGSLDGIKQGKIGLTA